MEFFPVFLSVVYILRNQSAQLEHILEIATKQISLLVSSYELIVVDNASDDNSVSVLKSLTSEKGLPNLQIYALTQKVDIDTASWVGLENALGDFVAIVDPLIDDIAFLPVMLDKALAGTNVVFANNQQKSTQNFLYRVIDRIFNNLFKRFNGVHLAKEAPRYRLLSKQVINFILQHSEPSVAYRYLPATGGFTKAYLNYIYATQPSMLPPKKLGESISRGIRLLVSTTQEPMRLVTALSLFGAIINLLYSIYVVVVGFLKVGVAPGWISLSLQQSGMFFLISLVLLALSEYVLHLSSISSQRPLWYVGQEFTSVHMVRSSKLNIEDSVSIYQ